MRKFDWFAWAFLLSLGALVTVKFAWFKEQYVQGARWAVEGWHWAGEHRPTVYAVVVAFVLGLLLGWSRNARLADRAIKALTRLTAEKTALERGVAQLTRQNAAYQREIEALQENQRETRFLEPPPAPRPAPAPAPAPPKPKRNTKKTKGAEPPPPVAHRPTAYDHLLADDLDHLDEPAAPPDTGVVKSA